MHTIYPSHRERALGPDRVARLLGASQVRQRLALAQLSTQNPSLASPTQHSVDHRKPLGARRHTQDGPQLDSLPCLSVKHSLELRHPRMPRQTPRPFFLHALGSLAPTLSWAPGVHAARVAQDKPVSECVRMCPNMSPHPIPRLFHALRPGSPGDQPTWPGIGRLCKNSKYAEKTSHLGCFDSLSSGRLIHTLRCRWRMFWNEPALRRMVSN